MPVAMAKAAVVRAEATFVMANAAIARTKTAIAVANAAFAKGEIGGKRPSSSPPPPAAALLLGSLATPARYHMDVNTLFQATQTTP